MDVRNKFLTHLINTPLLAPILGKIRCKFVVQSTNVKNSQYYDLRNAPLKPPILRTIWDNLSGIIQMSRA